MTCFLDFNVQKIRNVLVISDFNVAPHLNIVCVEMTSLFFALKTPLTF